MNKLLPCPFCGRDPEVIHYDTENDGVWCEWEIRCTHGLTANVIQGDSGNRWLFDCCSYGDKLETVSDQWNTRYERTCHIIKADDGRDVCSECGQPIRYRAYYCSDCGAKVVDDE